MRFKRIIAAIDLDDDLAESVVAVASSLAQKDDAKLDVISVWPTISIVAPTFSGEMAASTSAITQAAIDEHAAGRARATARLTKFVQTHNAHATTHMLDGDAAHETTTFAKKNGADLIVTGSHQRNFWGALFQGSASRELVQDAPCAVFLVTEAFAKSRNV